MTDENTTPAAQGTAASDSAATNGSNTPPATGESGTLPARGKRIFTLPPHPNTTFDEENFVTLLEGSISLTLEEKKRVVDAIPRLSIEQIDELVKIFEEEKEKFSELEQEYAEDVAKLKQQREKEIKMAEVQQEEAVKSEDEAAEAEALKKSLGL